MALLSECNGQLKIGSWLRRDGVCGFRVWAPDAKWVELQIETAPEPQPMERDDSGYWYCEAEGIARGTRYRYRLNNEKLLPDPASHWQPEGVHGPSAVADHASFLWGDSGWRGIELDGAVLYELHTGTFTEEGTFDGVLRRLDHLVALGVNAVELMPITHFPGRRNWGYDGVYPFAVHTAYGGVKGLKRLVDSCHKRDVAVVLDVVYNHLGPEGNYIWEYGPYFTSDKYRTPWGWAVNFDDAGSDGVRDYFISNALYWMEYFHIDGLRLDAVHSIFDMSARPFLEEMAAAVHAYAERTGIKRFCIAESDLNDPRIVRAPDRGGMGFDAQWSDDLHHALHAVQTGEREGYYQDFGSVRYVAEALSHGYAYRGAYSAFRKRRYGREPEGVDAGSFVVCSQNHDQVGNRMLGERLISLAGADASRLAAAVVILSPMVPLLFMGEEWGESNPFMYFVDHGDEALIAAVREGRKREFEAFHREGGAPDPTDTATFESSRPDWTRVHGSGGKMLEYYRYLIRLRKSDPVARQLTFNNMDVRVDAQNPLLMTVLRRSGPDGLFMAVNFGGQPSRFSFPPDSGWCLVLNSASARWGGHETAFPGDASSEAANIAARSCRVYTLSKGNRR